MIQVVDPLKFKIEELLKTGEPNSFNEARLRYGIEKDIHTLLEITRSIISDQRRYFFIDLTPFERIGHLEIFIAEIKKLTYPRPVLMVLADSLYDSIVKIDDKSTVLIAKYKTNGMFDYIKGGLENDGVFKENIIMDLQYKQINPDLVEFRRIIASQNYLELLFDTNCIDIPRQNDDPSSVSNISGNFYRVMPNNMLVSCYLNLKKIGGNYKSLIDLSYEIIMELAGCFRRDIDQLEEFDIIVVPNNTALFLTSTVQAIINKPLICVDKLGPIPSLTLHRGLLGKSLKDKNVILIEEVVATGNEVDRSVFFLNSMKANTLKIIALYNLEVGMPYLVKQNKIISLCKPKDKLKYEYRSK